MAQGNFGADADWAVSPRDQEMLARCAAATRRAPRAAHAADNDDTSFDDLFDGAAYRAAQTTFAGQANPRAPLGQSHYRAAVDYAPQGMPRALSSAHWAHLPADVLAPPGGPAGPGGAGGRRAAGPRPGQARRAALYAFAG